MKYRIAMVLLLANLASTQAGAATGQAKSKASKAEAKSSVVTTVETICAACHAVDGNSVVPANPKLAGQHVDYLQKQLQDFKSGTRASPVMAGMMTTLEVGEMQALAGYFTAQKPKPGVAQTNGKGSLGESLYRNGNARTSTVACAACHLPNGAGVPGSYPRLSGQNADYVVTQLQAFRSGTRTNDAASVMRNIAARLSDQEIAAVADYIQGLH